jgi:hypothetical protein
LNGQHQVEADQIERIRVRRQLARRRRALAPAFATFRELGELRGNQID